MSHHSNISYTQIITAAFWARIDVNVRHLHLYLACDWCIQQPTAVQVVVIVTTSVTNRSKRLWFRGHPQGAATFIYVTETDIATQSNYVALWDFVSVCDIHMQIYLFVINLPTAAL